MWIEAAGDLREAGKRISYLAARDRGEYFVCDQRSQQIVAKIANAAAS